MTADNKGERERMSRNMGPEREYILSFSSFYKAAYAQDVLEEGGFRGTLKKLPPELVRSCGTGIYMRTDTIERVRVILRDRQIVPTGIYLILRDEEISAEGTDNKTRQTNFQGKRYAKVK